MKKQRRRWVLYGGLAVVLLACAYVVWAVLRPLPAVLPEQATIRRSVTTGTSHINWPATGQAAVGFGSSNDIITNGSQTPAPTASTAKVITALLALQKKPLSPGESGPLVTMSAADVASYQSYAAQNGSTLPVQAGEQLSEYQLLEAMMLPSANNIADTTALWAYGSLPAYAAAANAYLAQHGIAHTRVGSDASGLIPDTTSTAADLVSIGKLAMASPVLAQIVGQDTADGFPVVGTIKNVNFLLGQANIVGIKTGNSDQAGGVFLGAAKTTVNGKPVTIISAVMNMPNLESALTSSLPLIESAETNFTVTPIYTPEQVIGEYQAPWGATARAITHAAVTATSRQGEIVTAQASLQSIRPNTLPAAIGVIRVHSNISSSVQPIVLAEPLAPPSLQWRLLHPLPIK